MTDASDPSSSPCLEMAHVLFMDIVAYSTLHMDRQQQLLQDLQEAVCSTPTFVRAQTQDQLIRLPTGDGMALVFSQDPEAPVRCALELAKVLRGNPDLKLRMGIHTGPVYRVADINKNRNVAGGGINIAQRVMDCGDAGHILVSSTYAEVLRQVSSWCAMLQDLGEAEVKHGVRVHLFNLHTGEVGNPEPPAKIVGQWASVLAAASAKRKKRKPLVMTCAAVLVLIAVGTLFYSRKAHALNEKDTLVLADFANTTSDAVFDGTLRQGLSVQLEQSPFLSLISDGRIQKTLRLMGLPGETKLTPEVAREVCERTASAAVLEGSIASLGSQYVLGLRARDCRTGTVLDDEQVQAARKEDVLNSLTQIASKFRTRVGESLATVEEHDTPLVEATTPSLEALKAYSTGWRVNLSNGSAAAVPFFKRAIGIDPKFAMAHALLGLIYSNVGESVLSMESTSKAYQLRDRTSDRERFFIEAMYDRQVTGNLERAKQTLELWARTYPRDVLAHGIQSGFSTQGTGKYEQSIEEANKTIAIDPDSTFAYVNIANSNFYLDRQDEAEKSIERATERKLEVPELLLLRYYIAFLKSDRSGMEREIALSRTEPGVEDWVTHSEALVLARSGQLQQAGRMSQRAVDLAEQAGQQERAATYVAGKAVWEAFYGNVPGARRDAIAALGISKGRDVEYAAAFALALSGDFSRSQALADDLEKRFPEDTSVRFNYLPALRGLFALNHSEPQKALKLLQGNGPYEFAVPGITFFAFFGTLYPAYVRGEAYLALHQNAAAATEFQKILDHRGLVFGDPVGALAHLQLGRAYALQADNAKARAAYQDFFALWKDADPDIPILKQAKAEYAKLQ